MNTHIQDKLYLDIYTEHKPCHRLQTWLHFNMSTFLNICILNGNLNLLIKALAAWCSSMSALTLHVTATMS